MSSHEETCFSLREVIEEFKTHDRNVMAFFDAVGIKDFYRDTEVSDWLE